MELRRMMLTAMLIGLAVAALAQEPPNLVASHQTRVTESGYTQIDFTLRDIPEQAILSFGVRFEHRFV